MSLNRSPEAVHFSYLSRRQQPGLPRSDSFCTYSSSIILGSSHIKASELGKGSYGAVSLMMPCYANYKKIAVKELHKITTEFSQHVSDEMIKTSFAKEQTLLCNLGSNEAKYNYLITNVGAFFTTDEPLLIETIGETKKLSSYPHNYIAMEYVDGTLMAKFKIESADIYLEICLAALNALNDLHAKIIHCDIKNDNVVVCREDKNANYTVRFIDFSISKANGELIPLKELNLNLSCKPPEFKNKDSILAQPNQDIYCLGRLLKEKYNKNLLSEFLASEVEKIHASMTHNQPEMRITVSEAIKRFLVIKKFLTVDENNQNDFLQYKFTVLRDKLEKNFKDTDAVDKWCYCERFILELHVTKNPAGTFSAATAGYSKVTDKKSAWVNLHGILRLTERETINATGILASLQHLESYDNKLRLLRHFFAFDAAFLARHFIQAEHITALLNLFCNQDKNPILTLFQSKLSHYEQLAQTNSDNEALLDKWLYCQRFIHQLKSNTNGEDQHIVSCATAGYLSLHQKWKPSHGAVRYLEHVINKDMKKLYDLVEDFPEKIKIKLLNCLFNTSSGSSLTHDFATHLISGGRSFKGAVKFVDWYDRADDHSVYKNLILAFNKIYRETRAGNPKKRYGFFGYTKQQKITASEQLETNDPNAFKNRAARHGDLGFVAERLKKVM